ncbi:hypothetical protein FRC01_006092 [Tulasnella sp. 417]|nr:hypothetical protein FRC01_006092 [Tulasnella sp. 417]
MERGKAIDLHLFAFAKAWTTVTKALKAIDFTVDLLKFILISGSSELELLEEDHLTPDRLFSQHRSQEPPDSPSYPCIRVQDHPAKSPEQPSPPLAASPPPSDTPRYHGKATSTSNVDRSSDRTGGSNATSIEPATWFDQSSNVGAPGRNHDDRAATFGSTSFARVSQSTCIGIPHAVRRNRTAMTDADRQRVSSVVLPSLPRTSSDAGPANQIGPDVFAAKVVPLPKRLRKLALKGRAPTHVNSSPLSRTVVHEELGGSSSSYPHSRLIAALPKPSSNNGLALINVDDIPHPKIIIHEDLPDSSISHPPSPAFATSATTSSPYSTWSSQTAASNPSPQFDLRSRFERKVTNHATGLTRTRPTLLTPPHVAFNGKLLGSPASIRGDSPTSDTYTTTTTTAFSYARSTSTVHTAITTPSSSLLEFEHEGEREIRTGGLDSTPDNAPAEVQSPQRGSENAGEVVAPSQWEQGRAVDRRAESGRCLQASARLQSNDDEDEGVTERDYRWQWAKREGKRPERGRRTRRRERVTRKPMPMPEPSPRAAWGIEHSGLDAQGFSQADIDKVVMMSLGLAVDPAPLRQSSPSAAPVDGGLPASVTHPSPVLPNAIVSQAGDHGEVDEYGFSKNELAQVLAQSRQSAPRGWGASYGQPTGTINNRSLSLSVPGAPTGDETDSDEDDTDSDEDDDEDEDEDDVDEEGFSKKERRKAMVKSRKAARRAADRPFYGASTSSTRKGPLSQEKWDKLEEFEAAPSSSREIRPPSPVLTHVDAETIVQHWSPPPPPPPPQPEGAPAKAKRLPRLRKFIKKFIPRNPFKLRGRANAAH